MRKNKTVKQIVLGQDDISALLPPRPINVHKYSAGSVLVIAGSRGMTGAATLAARAALRSGAGLVTLAAPSVFADMLDVQTPEILTLPLPANRGALAPESLEILRAALKRCDCVLIGPGLSSRPPVLKLVRDILQLISNYYPRLRVVLDADGLKALPLLQRSGLRMRWIITPHVGELAVMLNRSPAVIRRNPYQAALRAALKYQAVVVLKNADKTYIVDKPGRYFLNHNGNPGMATAGSGDVLAGITVGLWASTRGMTALRAAVVAPYLHGLAGNLASEEYSIDGIIAGDILNCVPKALKVLKGE